MPMIVRLFAIVFFGLFLGLAPVLGHGMAVMPSPCSEAGQTMATQDVMTGQMNDCGHEHRAPLHHAQHCLMPGFCSFAGAMTMLPEKVVGIVPRSDGLAFPVAPELPMPGLIPQPPFEPPRGELSHRFQASLI